MDGELKKSIGYLLLAVLGAAGVYFAGILPDIIISGEMIVFFTAIISAVSLFLRKVISIYTGVPIDESEIPDTGTDS